ncbi:hypothetical protein [Myxococcus sp. AB056]|uniref:hypothetical protein n=1 Tax=Myxococcus sp. AB056 TaxID=2562792 RepID=UPI001147057A|nr:hypothetical protein [Myxococcus sp. AB056]
MTLQARCTEAELAVLKELTAYLQVHVWTGPGTPVERHLALWQNLAFSLGEYRGGIDDYIYSLHSRDRLEVIIKESPGPHNELLQRLVSEADETFRNATRDDGGQSLSEFLMPAANRGWWYSRRPIIGPLNTYLDAGEA